MAEKIEEYITILLSFQQKCEEAGNYKEAKLTQKRIEEIRREIEENTKEELNIKHLKERLNLENAHKIKMSEFNQEWSQKLNTLHEQADTLEKELKERHKKEKAVLIVDIESNTKSFKPTPDYLKLKESEYIYGKQKKYEEAESIQKERTKLEKSLQDSADKQKQEKLKLAVAALEQKQYNEFDALQTKNKSNQNELILQKEKAFISLKQKLENLRLQLIKQHNKEKYEMQKITQHIKAKREANCPKHISIPKSESPPKHK